MASNVLDKRTKGKGGYHDGLASPIIPIVAAPGAGTRNY